MNLIIRIKLRISGPKCDKLALLLSSLLRFLTCSCRTTGKPFCGITAPSSLLSIAISLVAYVSPANGGWPLRRIQCTVPRKRKTRQISLKDRAAERKLIGWATGVALSYDSGNGCIASRRAAAFGSQKLPIRVLEMLLETGRMVFELELLHLWRLHP